MAEGCDVSEHQGTLPPTFFDAYDFVIIRAFNENGNPDRTFNDNWRKAAGRTLRGVYGWPTPFIAGDDFRLGQITVDIAPDAEAGYWADREWVNGGVASAADVENYLRGIESRGKLAGVYSNIGELPRSPYLDAHHWWMADYDDNDGVRHDPYRKAPVPPRDRPYTIHQYTSRPIDKNWSADLAWTGSAPATPTAEEDSMYIVQARETGVQTLYTALGATPNIDAGFADELVKSGVPRYAMSGNATESVSLIHGAHYAQLVKDVVTKVTGASSAAVPFDFSGTATPHA